MGHSSIQITADRYGHLFPWGDDSAGKGVPGKLRRYCYADAFPQSLDRARRDHLDMIKA
jgi:hypothetical protein